MYLVTYTRTNVMYEDAQRFTESHDESSEFDTLEKAQAFIEATKKPPAPGNRWYNEYTNVKLYQQIG